MLPVATHRTNCASTGSVKGLSSRRLPHLESVQDFLSRDVMAGTGGPLESGISLARMQGQTHADFPPDSTPKNALQGHARRCDGPLVRGLRASPDILRR